MGGVRLETECERFRRCPSTSVNFDRLKGGGGYGMNEKESFHFRMRGGTTVIYGYLRVVANVGMEFETSHEWCTPTMMPPPISLVVKWPSSPAKRLAA